MGADSKIEWCRHTFNPWIGCTKVSDGCKFCYAEALMDKRWGKVKWGPSGERQRTSESNWQQPLKWDRAADKAGERHRVFCASLADVFEDRDELKPWRAELFSLILQTKNLDWLVLTKRPENSHQMMKDSGFYCSVNHNLWLGTSVENQTMAHERIPHLLRCPAAVRFLSCEPLLGQLRLKPYLANNYTTRCPGSEAASLPSVDWAIVGSESGPGRREMKTEWADQIRAQCAEAGVAFFMKQMDVDGKVSGDIGEFPESLRVRQFPVHHSPHRATAGKEQT